MKRNIVIRLVSPVTLFRLPQTRFAVKFFSYFFIDVCFNNILHYYEKVIFLAMRPENGYRMYKVIRKKASL